VGENENGSRKKEKNQTKKTKGKINWLEKNKRGKIHETIKRDDPEKKDCKKQGGYEEEEKNRKERLRVGGSLGGGVWGLHKASRIVGGKR